MRNPYWLYLGGAWLLFWLLIAVAVLWSAGASSCPSDKPGKRAARRPAHPSKPPREESENE